MQKLQVLETFKQRPGDSVEQYHTALLKLFDELQLMGEFSSASHKLFVSGLNDRLQRHIASALLTSPKMTYDELVALALQHESIGKPTHVDGPAMRRVEHADRQFGSDSQHDASQEPSHSGTCPYCHAQGHT